ncbi:hypothetical protein BU26DRAFT_553663, partial [Trematosphaeria pertusa]
MLRGKRWAVAQRIDELEQVSADGEGTAEEKEGLNREVGCWRAAELGRASQLSSFQGCLFVVFNTTTTSLRPTRMSFWIPQMRRRDSSERRIMPSILSAIISFSRLDFPENPSYSKSFTYAPISAICFTFTITKLSTWIFLLMKAAICER